MTQLFETSTARLLGASYLIGLLLLTGCGKDHFFDFTKSAGKTVTQYRTCSDFTELQLEDDVDVILYPETSPFLRVTAGQNIIEGITTRIEGHTLRIANQNRSNWVRSFKTSYLVEAGCRRLDKISYYGSGSVHTSDSIRSGFFTFDCWNGSGSVQLLLSCTEAHLNIHNGRCDVTASGLSDVTYFYLNDTGVMDGSLLHSGFTYARNSGTGLLRLHAEKELGVEILHTGDIRYRGTPYRIDRRIIGSGRLLQE